MDQISILSWLEVVVLDRVLDSPEPKDAASFIRINPKFKTLWYSVQDNRTIEKRAQKKTHLWVDFEIFKANPKLYNVIVAELTEAVYNEILPAYKCLNLDADEVHENPEADSFKRQKAAPFVLYFLNSFTRKDFEKILKVFLRIQSYLFQHEIKPTRNTRLLSPSDVILADFWIFRLAKSEDGEYHSAFSPTAITLAQEARKTTHFRYLCIKLLSEVSVEVINSAIDMYIESSPKKTGFFSSFLIPKETIDFLKITKPLLGIRTDFRFKLFAESKVIINTFDVSDRERAQIALNYIAKHDTIFDNEKCAPKDLFAKCLVDAICQSTQTAKLNNETKEEVKESKSPISIPGL